MRTLFFRGLLLISLSVPVLCGAALTDLVKAAKTFSVAIRQQLELVESDPSPAELAEQTMDYAEAKSAYYEAFTTSIPELREVAKSKGPRPPEMIELEEAFSLAGENQRKEADQETSNFLQQFMDEPEIEKAMLQFEAAQKKETSFGEEFGRLDFARQLGALSFPGLTDLNFEKTPTKSNAKE
jgi:hypothetical protein